MGIRTRNTIDLDPSAKTCFEYDVGRKRLRFYRDGIVVLNCTEGAIMPSGVQGAAISDPSGGTTTDAEARAAINDILAVLRTFGMIMP